MKTYEDISKDLGDIKQENAAIVDEQRELDGIKRYEEAVVKVELARDIQNKSGDPHNFDKNLFKNKRKALKNERDNANQEEQKKEIENKIRLLNDLQNKANDENSLEEAVNTIKADGDKIIRSFYERKGESVDITDPNQLEAYKKRFLGKDKPRLQKNEDWKESRGNKTNVIEHQAYWENTKKNIDFENLDKSKETYENLKDLGDDDLAEQFKTGSYKARLSKAYNTLKTGYEEVENKKSGIDKKIGTLSQKLWGEPISPEEKKKIEEEVETLKTESVALRKIMDEQYKTLFEDLENKHNLSDILDEDTTDTPSKEKNKTRVERRTDENSAQEININKGKQEVPEIEIENLFKKFRKILGKGENLVKTENYLNSILVKLENDNSNYDYSLSELNKIDSLIFFGKVHLYREKELDKMQLLNSMQKKVRKTKQTILKKSGILEHVKYEEEPEKINSVLKKIELNLAKQPKSLQDMYPKMKDRFLLFTETKSHRHLWTATNSSCETIAWVEDKNKPGEWKVRFFRQSGSDKQSKAFVGHREDGAIKKGEEDNPKHHYVQSAKLHKDIYKILNYLPIDEKELDGTNPLFSSYVPEDNGRYDQENEFKENHMSFKKESWRRVQNHVNHFYNYYQILNNKKWIETNPNKLYKFLEENGDIKYLAEIKLYIDTSFGTNKDSKTWIKDEKFLRIYNKNISEVFKKVFSEIKYPKEMVPNFAQEPEDQYMKTTLTLPRNDFGEHINIEEYRVKNEEGDEIIFAMAHDSKGRVYIDNIYDPRVGFNSYGTLNKIVKMGYLIYKPEDYKEQTIGLSDNYKGKENGSYIEINKLWEEDPIIKKYKESLIQRGILKKDKQPQDNG